MKVGILTYHRAHNYGALLQAYALKISISRLGHQVEIVDYWPNYHAEDYKLIPYYKSRSILGKIKAIILLLIGYSKIIKRAAGYKQFIIKQLNLSDQPLYCTEDELGKTEYDAIVYGSDQIWRRSNYPIFKGFSDVYFGAYPTKVKRKISYAASMGIIDVNETERFYIKQMLTNFDSISVREEDLKQLIESITGNQTSLVLDPVFLLNKEEWAKLPPISKTAFKDKYIFFYQLVSSKDAIEFTNRLKSHFGYKVIEIRGRVEPLLFGNRYFQTANPFDFISLIKNAEIVVSTSFHGVAFSLIFEKQFYALGMKNNSGRVQTLLNKLNLSARLVDEKNNINFEELIDYEKVNSILNLLKQKSHNYLVNSLDVRK